MDKENYFTVTSQKNASNFVSNFTNPINLSDNYEIGLKSVSHGSTYNVTSKTNRITLLRDDGNNHIEHIFLDTGCYHTKSELFHEIQSKLLDFFNTTTSKLWSRDVPKYFIESDGRITIKLPPPLSVTRPIYFLIDNKTWPGQNPLSNILNFPDNKYKKISDFREFISIKPTLGFIYSSVVAESYINNHKSRLLAIAPFYSADGYNYFEFLNISYYPLSVNTFTDIFFSIKDENGDELNLSKTTILNLHVRKRL